ncbi:MAG: shikimate dehydrogenase [Clostridiales bacterium]|nr:shikimate dehydrogenase [Clostridiales bacterium]
MTNIENLRRQIDSLDEEIKSLLLKRLEIVSEIGKIKGENLIAVKDRRREEEIIKRLTENAGRQGETYIKHIYDSVFEASRNLEERKYGVVGGESLVSKSPFIHNAFGNPHYSAYPVKPEDLKSFVQNSDLSGYNVTMPHKVSVMEYLDEVSPEAKAIGAVNTVVVKGNKKIGYNTDYMGFIEALRYHRIRVDGKKVCVLGSGGASKAVRYALGQEKAKEIIVVSRAGEITYADTAVYADAEVLINCTPVGYGQGNSDTPVDISRYANLEGVYDAIYIPDPTRLVFEARQAGINAHNGLYMLIAQAAHSHRLFGLPYPEGGVIEGLYRRLSKKSIVLMGMPGSGKTELGKLLAISRNLSYADTDELIEAETGTPVPKIIKEYGEAYFREIEKSIIKKLSTNPPDVISLGGGAVKDKENRYLIKSMGRVFWIIRDIDSLATSGRPLSVDLEKLVKERYPIYESLCDEKINNNCRISEAFEEITKLL